MSARTRVLAQDVESSVFLPPRDNASMDGFAVRAADVPDVPTTLRVVETIPAGALPSRAIGQGEAARIMTGAYVPTGADSVVRVEDTEGDDVSVSILNTRDLERNIRARGEDVQAGQRVMARGTAIGAAHIGVLSSVGCATPLVYRRPRVAILATGDELVPVDRIDDVRAGTRIISSNSYSLAAAVEEAGGESISLGIAPDDPDGLARSLRAAEGCDFVITSGGVSVGDFDYTKRVVETLGGTLSLWRVRMRPGAPIGFGTLFGAPWLGLPGNPVSALVTFELFGRPLVRSMGGHSRPHRRLIAVTLGDDIQVNAPLTHFLRVTLQPGRGDFPVARLTGTQSSGVLTSMSAAHALLIVSGEIPTLEAGITMRAIPLDGDLGGSDTFLQ
jgi:molybdopterin molybdotransferase